MSSWLLLLTEEGKEGALLLGEGSVNEVIRHVNPGATCVEVASNSGSGRAVLKLYCGYLEEGVLIVLEMELNLEENHSKWKLGLTEPLDKVNWNVDVSELRRGVVIRSSMCGPSCDQSQAAGGLRQVLRLKSKRLFGRRRGTL